MHRLITTFLAALVLLFSSGAMAQQAATAEQLANALGLPQILAAAKQRNADNAREQLNVAFSQLAKNGMPEEVVNEMRERAQPMLARIIRSWDEAEAARIYASEIAAALSPEELQEALDYYSTDEGKNTYDAIASGQSKMSSYINAQVAQSMKAEFGSLMAQMKEITREYHEKHKKQ